MTSKMDMNHSCPKPSIFSEQWKKTPVLTAAWIGSSYMEYRYEVTWAVRPGHCRVHCTNKTVKSYVDSGSLNGLVSSSEKKARKVMNRPG